jgi:hypothetical protein
MFKSFENGERQLDAIVSKAMRLGRQRPYNTIISYLSTEEQLRYIETFGGNCTEQNRIASQVLRRNNIPHTFITAPLRNLEYDHYAILIRFRGLVYYLDPFLSKVGFNITSLVRGDMSVIIYESIRITYTSNYLVVQLLDAQEKPKLSYNFYLPEEDSYLPNTTDPMFKSESKGAGKPFLTFQRDTDHGFYRMTLDMKTGNTTLVVDKDGRSSKLKLSSTKNYDQFTAELQQFSYDVDIPLYEIFNFLYTGLSRYNQSQVNS